MNGKRALKFSVHLERFSIFTVLSTTPIQPGRDPFLPSRPSSRRAYHQRSSTKYMLKPRFQPAAPSPWKDRVKHHYPEALTFLVLETRLLSRRSPMALFLMPVVLISSEESKSTPCVTYRRESFRQRASCMAQTTRWSRLKSVVSYPGYFRRKA